jgi:hypothetical protein
MLNRFTVSIIFLVYFILNSIPLFWDGYILSGFNSIVVGIILALSILRADVLTKGNYVCLFLGFSSVMLEALPKISNNSQLYSEAVFAIIDKLNPNDSNVLVSCMNQTKKDLMVAMLESFKVVYFNALMSALDLLLNVFRDPIPNQCIDALNSLKISEPQSFSNLSKEANEILFKNSK